MYLLENGLEFDGGSFRCAWFHILGDDGRELWRAATFKELASLAIDPTKPNDESLMGKQWAGVRGLYNAGVNFVYTSAGIFKPERVGIVQLYGVAETAPTKEEAIAHTASEMPAVEAMLAGYAQSKLRAPDVDLMSWYVDFMANHASLLVILGQPDPRVKSTTMGIDGATADESKNDLAFEQNEILFRGLAKLGKNFIFQMLGEHVPRKRLAQNLIEVSRVASNFASRVHGNKTINFGVGIPIMNSLAQGFNAVASHGATQGTSISDGTSAAHSVGHTDSWSHTDSSSTSVGHTAGWSESGSHTDSASQAHTASMGDTVSASHTVSAAHSLSGSDTASTSHSSSVSDGTSWSHGTSSSDGTSATTSAGGSHTTSTGSGTNWSDSSGTSHSTNHSDGTNVENSSGQNQSVNLGTNIGVRGGAGIGVVNVGANVGTSAGYTTGTTTGHSEGASTSNGWSDGTSTGHSDGGSTSQGVSDGTSWGTSAGTSHSTGVSDSTGGSHSVGSSDTTGQAHTSGWTDSTGSADSTGTAHSTGTADTTGTGTADSAGWGQNGAVVNTSSSGHADSTGGADSTTETTGTSHANGQSAGTSTSYGGSSVATAGMSFGIVPNISMGRSWQMEDDTAARLTEVFRGLESIVNTASAEGGFMANSYVIGEDEQTLQAAAALVPEAFHGPGVPTPVMTIEPEAQDREDVITAARAFLPFSEHAQGDALDGITWTKYATLLTAGMVAAYTSPGLMPEGTIKVIAPIPEPMAFYPRMPGDLILGHQYSPATAELTNTPVKLDRGRLMHTLFAANTGYGKSVAAMRMAYEIATKWRMRVVVLDFGFSWRQLLNAAGLEGRVDVRQLRPDGVRPLRWNPLQIGTYINPETQLRSFADIFGTVARLGQRQQQHRLLDALRSVYVKHGVMVNDPDVRSDPRWGKVEQGETGLAGAPAGTPLDELEPEQRQQIAVERSKTCGMDDLYAELEQMARDINPRDVTAKGVIEGINVRLNSLVKGEAAAQFAAGTDTTPIEDLGRPDGVVILEGGKFLDNFSKAFLLGWAGWLIYSDMVARRERQINRGEADLFMVFEEANIIFSGLEGGEDDDEGGGGPSVSEQYANMFRDARKYGAFFAVITQSPSLIPAGIRNSCNNLMIGYLSDSKDKDVVLAALARSEKGFRDEPWRRFIDDISVGMLIGRLPYVTEREMQQPFLFHPLMLLAPEPSDAEIAQKLGRIKL